ncbi:MAG: DUF4118 domain-containing protein, partial [Alicycliphilus sp.]|nr:DUF4118 domain-containing protein [Alicycliphilus sp.]
DLPWHAVFVDAPAQQRVDPAARQHALRALKLAQDLGAMTATPTGIGVAQALVRYAREHNLSRLVLGRRQGRRRWRLSMTERLADLTPDMDVLQVPLPPKAHGRQRPADARAKKPYWPGYLAATGACALVALLAGALHGVLELTNIVMLFLLSVVGVALLFGRGPATLAALLGVAMFDFFFVPPRMSFNVSDVQYLITFAVMLVVALVIGQLTAGLRAEFAGPRRGGAPGPRGAAAAPGRGPVRVRAGEPAGKRRQVHAAGHAAADRRRAAGRGRAHHRGRRGPRPAARQGGGGV